MGYMHYNLIIVNSLQAAFVRGKKIQITMTLVMSVEFCISILFYGWVEKKPILDFVTSNVKIF